MRLVLLVMIGLTEDSAFSLVGSISGSAGCHSFIRCRTRLCNIVLDSDNCTTVSLMPTFAVSECVLDRLLAEYDMPQVLEDPP